MKNFKNILAELIATSFYIGKAKYCPGTFGSLVAFPIFYIICQFTIDHQIVFHFFKYDILVKQLLSSWLILFITCIVLYFIGLIATKVYLNYLKDIGKSSTDPREVVIDEVVGQLLGITLCLPSLILPWHRITNISSSIIIIVLSLIFLLFRFFDILKPWPINWFDQNVKNAHGVMIDDVVAAFFASVTHYAIILTILNVI